MRSKRCAMQNQRITLTLTFKRGLAQNRCSETDNSYVMSIALHLPSFWNRGSKQLRNSGRKNVLRKPLPTPHRRLKAGFSVCWLAVSTVFVCHWESFDWDWVKCTRSERLLLKKPFHLCVVFVLRHLKITLDSEQPMLKQKRIIPSVWGGIKSFEHFQRGEYFSDCAFDLFVSWFHLLSPGWIKTRLYSVYLVNTLSHAQIYSLCRISFILLFSQRTIFAP